MMSNNKSYFWFVPAQSMEYICRKVLCNSYELVRFNMHYISVIYVLIPSQITFHIPYQTPSAVSKRAISYELWLVEAIRLETRKIDRERNPHFVWEHLYEYAVNSTIKMINNKWVPTLLFDLMELTAQ